MLHTQSDSRFPYLLAVCTIIIADVNRMRLLNLHSNSLWLTREAGATEQHAANRNTCLAIAGCLVHSPFPLASWTIEASLPVPVQVRLSLVLASQAKEKRLWFAVTSRHASASKTSRYNADGTWKLLMDNTKMRKLKQRKATIRHKLPEPDTIDTSDIACCQDT